MPKEDTTVYSKMISPRRIAGAVLGIAAVLAFGAAVAGGAQTTATHASSVFTYPVPDPNVLHGIPGPGEGSAE